MQCYLCKKHFITLNKYLLHIEYFHKISNYFKCPFGDCVRLYDKKTSFRKHIKCEHMNSAIITNNSNMNLEDTATTCSTINSSAAIFDNNNLTDASDEHEYKLGMQSKHSSFSSLLKQAIKIFISKCYSMSINRSILQEILDNITSFFGSGIIQILIESCNIVLSNSQSSQSDNNLFIQMLKLLENPFAPLKTEYKRLKFFEQSEKMIHPELNFLGVTGTEKKKNTNIAMTLKEDYSCFIPMRKTLKIFLELPQVLEKILNYQESLKCNQNIFCNIIQADLWKNLSMSDNSDILLPIVLYYDDFEILNPLGSHAGLYKMGGVYFFIPTVPPCYASRLENIFLVMLFYSKDREKYGNQKIFRVVVEELKYLEKVGISVCQNNNSTRQIKFKLVLITGDNAGLNSILGFNESFSSTYYCRFCTTPKSLCEKTTRENKCSLRANENYNDHFECNIGIKEKSIWNELNNFTVYNNFFCDIMHDLFEGIHRYEMCLIINKLIERRYFSLEMLNSRIKYFNHNSNEKNLPPGFTKEQLQKNCLIVSASEMLFLVKNFRFIVGEYINRDDDVWELYLLLFEITEILTCRSFRYETLEYLDDLIEEHHLLYLQLSENHLKPKHHFLIHYSGIAKKVGPLIPLCSMRTEGKHQEFKIIAQNIRCRKNVPFTLSLRHQLKQCSRFMSETGLNDHINYGILKEIHNEHLISVQKVNLTDYCSVNFYEINGIKYEYHSMLKIDLNDDMPTFLEVSDILLNKDYSQSVYLFGKVWHTQAFDPHFKAYVIVQSNRKDILPLHKFKNELPGIKYNVSDKVYATIP